MSRKTHFDEAVVEFARKQAKEARTARDLRAALSVTMSVVCRVPNRIIAEVFGVSLATVNRMQKEIRERASGRTRPKRSWGGRRRQLMSIEEEKAFLDRWAEQAERGGVLVVPPIHAALEEKLGRPVAKSTVYRMLARHGWRKVEPDTCHPKRNVEAQEAFKKGASRKVWKKL